MDRNGHAQALHDGGADVVVTDLAQVCVAMESPSAWSLLFENFDPAQEGIREALCTLGNGYFATRGAVTGAAADDVHYPGTYLAGGYNRLRTDIAGRVVENEDLVNFPNWLALEFRIADGDWFDARTVKLGRIARNWISDVACYCGRLATKTTPDVTVREGTTTRLDGRHAFGRDRTFAHRRELVGQHHSTFGD